MSRLFSIRMRAALSSEHISGAERIAPAQDLATIASAMITRALDHSRGNPDTIHLTIDTLPATSIEHAPLPDITTVLVSNLHAGRSAARAELLRAGVSDTAASAAIRALASGAAPGGKVMRGAMLVDAKNGERLESDHARGLRVSRMDLSQAAHIALTAALQGSGRDTAHLREALALAGKVLLSPGIVAELCWSDDPDYTAGYVASPLRGYVRFPHLKEKGDRLGGRAFFYQRSTFNLAAITAFLEEEPVLFSQIGRIHHDEVFSG
ncbi:MAG: 6-carboxyhexanoate--CoA ligase [Deltaproteobacteria bacterium HGW-Deltaproteobacteria-4]|nr:MAG: 6-carboxyhexanoate--CoA ligase [Deltaproteobacteria bacterium HGW-Deltaproteobacteria-4]